MFNFFAICLKSETAVNSDCELLKNLYTYGYVNHVCSTARRQSKSSDGDRSSQPVSHALRWAALHLLFEVKCLKHGFHRC